MRVADKTGTAGAAGRAPVADRPDRVRNVVLVGHSGAGKTTLVEALLAATGTIQRTGRVEDGTTVSDFDEVEVRQQRSVNLTVAPVMHAGIKINLLDTPGYADYVGDLRAGLRAADAALFAVSAAEGVDGLTRMLWDECAAVGTPPCCHRWRNCAAPSSRASSRKAKTRASWTGTCRMRKSTPRCSSRISRRQSPAAASIRCSPHRRHTGSA